MAIDKAEGRGTKKPAPYSPVLVLGVGNILLSDEGVGVRVVDAMKEMKLPGNVELLDGGTGAFDLIDVIADREKIIIIDAVNGGCEPGTIFRFSPEDFGAQHYHITSAHEVGLLDALAMAKIAGCSPRQIIIYGIEPKRLDWGTELSREVATIIPKVLELINSELKNES
jgi:hydrogenase maturation protease